MSLTPKELYRIGLVVQEENTLLSACFLIKTNLHTRYEKPVNTNVLYSLCIVWKLTLHTNMVRLV